MLIYIVFLLVTCVIAYTVSAFGLSATYTLACIVIPLIFLSLKGLILRKSGVEYWKIFIPFYGTYNLFKTVELNESVCRIAALVDIYSLYNWLSKVFPAVPTIKDLFISLIKSGAPSYVTILTLLFILGLTKLVMYTLLCFSLPKSFGKHDAFAVGLFLLPFIFFPILALDDSEYVY